MSQRTAVIEFLEPLIAAVDGLTDIKLVKSVRANDDLNRPALIVKTDSYEKLPQAPLTRRLGRFTLTLVSPHRNIDSAEDDLDDRLEILLPALISWGLIWDTATQVGYGDTYLAFDITIRSVLS